MFFSSAASSSDLERRVTRRRSSTTWRGDDLDSSRALVVDAPDATNRLLSGGDDEALDLLVLRTRARSEDHDDSGSRLYLAVDDDALGEPVLGLGDRLGLVDRARLGRGRLTSVKDTRLHVLLRVIVRLDREGPPPCGKRVREPLDLNVLPVENRLRVVAIREDRVTAAVHRPRIDPVDRGSRVVLEHDVGTGVAVVRVVPVRLHDSRVRADGVLRLRLGLGVRIR